jgi:hypothetical protein
MTRERCPNCKRAMPRPIPKRRAVPRKGPMRDPAYRRWCKRQPCALSGDRTGEFVTYRPEIRRAVIDPAHTRNNGMSSKGPDWSCVPLERALHDEYDADREGFEKKYHVNMAELAREHYSRYLQEKGQV